MASANVNPVEASLRLISNERTGWAATNGPAVVGIICSVALVECGTSSHISPDTGTNASPDSGGSGDVAYADAETPVLQGPSCATCANGWCSLTGATFIMGAPVSEPTRAAFSEDQVTVTLTHAFEISQYEITIGDWTALGLPVPKQPKQPSTCNDPKCPVYAGWYDALIYANTKSRLHNPPLPNCYQLTGCYSDAGTGTICNNAVESGPLYDCKGYRIPTEAEWEYACRAGTISAFYDGPVTPSAVPPGQNIALVCYDEPTLDPIGWYCTNSGGGPHPVGGKWPNPWCLYDMSGNRFEWTTGGYNGQPYGSSPQVDPGGLLGNFKLRVQRGGSYAGVPADATCFSRSGLPPQSPLDDPGIRLVRTIGIGDAGP